MVGRKKKLIFNDPARGSDIFSRGERGSNEGSRVEIGKSLDIGRDALIERINSVFKEIRKCFLFDSVSTVRFNFIEMGDEIWEIFRNICKLYIR